MKTTKTILIAEDESINFQYLHALLKDMYPNILHAFDGAEAIELCKKHRSIGLVLMDIGMPKIDGYEATVEIKKIRPNLPIIAQTAYALPEETRRAKNAGCDALITKPIKREDLLRALAPFL